MTSCQECIICCMLTAINKQTNKNITNTSQSLLLIYRLTINYVIHQPYQVGYIVGSNPDRVKPKTIKLVFVLSPLSTQH